MRIILGSILLAVAIAAPINEEPTDPLEKATRECINQTDGFIADLLPASGNYEEITVILRSKGVSEPAITDYFANGFVVVDSIVFTNGNYKTYFSFETWAKKWNVKELECIKEINKKMEAREEEPTVAVVRDCLRRTDKFIGELLPSSGNYEEITSILRSKGVSEEGITDYFLNGFVFVEAVVIANRNYKQHFDFLKWAEKWNVKELECLKSHPKKVKTTEETPGPNHSTVDAVLETPAAPLSEMDKKKKTGNEVLSKAIRFFEYGFIMTKALKSVAEDGKITKEEDDIIAGLFASLNHSEEEGRLFSNVFDIMFVIYAEEHGMAAKEVHDAYSALSVHN